MRTNEDIQVKLRERYRRLLTSDHDSYDRTAILVRDFIASEPLLVNLLAEAATVEPDLDPAEWISSLGRGPGSSSRWTHSTEAGQATLIWALLNAFDEGGATSRTAWSVTGLRNFNDACRRFTEMIMAPLFDYLIERVADANSVTHALERYVRMVEWFDREGLYAAFQADTAKGEAVYDTHLRRFLFSEGISMPFSQARSPSGDSDVVTQLDDDPLVCELKVFDGDNRAKRHVASGVHQAVQYALDYGQRVGYLVVINISGRPLELPTDGKPGEGLPFIDLGGVRVYLVAVRALRRTSASKEGRARPVIFSRDDLVDPDGD